MALLGALRTAVTALRQTPALFVVAVAFGLCLLPATIARLSTHSCRSPPVASLLAVPSSLGSTVGMATVALVSSVVLSVVAVVLLVLVVVQFFGHAVVVDGLDGGRQSRTQCRVCALQPPRRAWIHPPHGHGWRRLRPVRCALFTPRRTTVADTGRGPSRRRHRQRRPSHSTRRQSASLEPPDSLPSSSYRPGSSTASSPRSRRRATGRFDRPSVTRDRVLSAVRRS